MRPVAKPQALSSSRPSNAKGLPIGMRPVATSQALSLSRPSNTKESPIGMHPVATPQALSLLRPSELPFVSRELNTESPAAQRRIPSPNFREPSSAHHETVDTRLFELGRIESPLRDCSVCAESVLSKDFPSLKGCEHPPDVCRQCFLHWLEQQMASTTWEQVKCPSSGCKMFVTHEDVRKYASPQVFEK